MNLLQLITIVSFLLKIKGIKYNHRRYSLMICFALIMLEIWLQFIVSIKFADIIHHLIRSVKNFN